MLLPTKRSNVLVHEILRKSVETDPEDDLVKIETSIMK